jgi:hypothetical protein
MSPGCYETASLRLLNCIPKRVSGFMFAFAALQLTEISLSEFIPHAVPEGRVIISG